ncbi:MAG: hypothetical protein ACPHVJ_00310 [Psychrobacter sp.]
MAEKTEFLQAIDDAILDADSLEQFINGSDGETVLTRLSAEYPTLQKAIKQMFENGGLPATPFKTKAEMEASGLANGDYAVVTDDGSNNGLYIKQSEGWVVSEYNNEDIFADKYRLSKLVNLLDFISTTGGGDILSLFSGNDIKVLSIDENGYLHLPRMSLSVQEAISEVFSKTTLIYTSDEQSLLSVKDSAGVEVLRLDRSGGLFVYGLDKSVQKHLNDMSSTSGGGFVQKKDYSKSIEYGGSRYDLNDAVLDNLVKASFKYANISPVPLYMLPQKLNISTGWIDDAKIEVNQPEDFRPIAGYDPTYREDIGVVHPYLTAFSEKVAGFKYWLGINPYTNANEDIETAYLYGTNNPDLKNWELIPDFPAPFEEDPNDEDGAISGFMSDSFLTYDVHTGDLIFVWRKTLRYAEPINAAGDKMKFALRASRFDGNAWSEVYDLVSLRPPMTDGNYRSPSIVYNPSNNLYYMYYGWNGSLWYITCGSLDGSAWSEPFECTMINQNRTFWHVEVKPVGNKLVAIFHLEGIKEAFHLGFSEDYTTFTVASDSLFDVGDTIYKASVLPVINDDLSGVLKVAYTGIDQKLHIATTNTLNFGE